MADLSIEIAGIKFKNPVWFASGEPIWGFERIKRGIDAGAGAVVIKSIGIRTEATIETNMNVRYCVLDENRQQVHGKKIPKLFTLYNRSCFSCDEEDKFIGELEKGQKYAARNDAYVIGSIHPPMPIEQRVRIAKKMEQVGIKMIEIVDLLFGFGDAATDLRERARQLIQPVTQAVSVPVFAKLSPAGDVIGPARWSVEDFGAAGVIPCPTFIGCLNVDIETGKPTLFGWAGVGGPWKLPITLGWVSRIYKAMPHIPILGTGGVYDSRDVVAMHMAGASAVQICCAVMVKGYKVVTDAIAGLNDFLIRKGHKSVRDIIGCAAKTALLNEEIYKLPENKRTAGVDMEKCVDCGKCVEFCWFNAMEERDGVYKASSDCRGCGNCEVACPVEAITWTS